MCERPELYILAQTSRIVLWRQQRGAVVQRSLGFFNYREINELQSDCEVLRRGGRILFLV